MGRNRKEREQELAERICNNDWEGVQKLAEESAREDREFAARTGEIFWAHKHLAG